MEDYMTILDELAEFARKRVELAKKNISLDEIKKDPFVKKSAVFKSMVNYIEKNKK